MHNTKPTTRRVLLSTADKSGLVCFAKQLSNLDYNCIATGNTAKLLKKNKIAVTEISDVTHFPELLNGRVKTLHPNIHAGILARRGEDDDILTQHQIKPIDMIVVNLYPFEQTISKASCQFEEAIEKIDIGGPTLLRAAAKNHEHVTAITDPDDYGLIIDELNKTGNISKKTRRQLALKVFQLTSHYDTIIHRYLESQIGNTEHA